MWNAWVLAAALGGDLAPVRIELATGRADLALPSGVETLLGGGEARVVDGPAYLELGPASRLALRWRGEASLELRGSTALEWRAPRDGAGVMVTAWRVSELDFEVRRGPLRLDFGGGWRVELDVGAAGVRRLADGRLELRHVAGAPLALFHQSASGLVSPPWTVLPGAHVRLEAGAAPTFVQGPAPARPKAAFERLDDAPPWSDFAWPWGRNSRASAPFRGERAPQAEPARIESSRIAPASAPEEDATRVRGAVLELPRTRGEAGAPATRGTSPAAPETRSAVAPTAAGVLDPNRAAQTTSGPKPSASSPSSAPSRFDPSQYPPIRRHGELVDTPFGPRWADRP
jgi:hypothetical protein